MIPLLHQDCIRHIFSFLPFSLVVQICRTVPLTFEREKQLGQHKIFLQEKIPDVLLRTIGYLRLLDAPVLSWKDAFLGGTGYIDSIKLHNVSAPIMIGCDNFCRPFITIRSYSHWQQTYGLVTLFQRYADKEGTWTVGTRYGMQWVHSSTYFLVNDKIHPSFEKSLMTLCRSERVVHPFSHDVYSMS